MFGYDRQELIGQNPRIFRSDVHAHEFFADMWQTELEPPELAGRAGQRRKDGTLIDSR